ncbi:MAG: DCC1-like thiol-disulfide oxidoreductase family protein [Halobacteriales archaeon]
MSDAMLVYDDDCGFCTWWADLFRDHSDIRLVGFSELTDDLREQLPSDYRQCSHLITDESVYSCGASIEEAFLRSDLGDDIRPVLSFIRQFEEYHDLRERGYRFVAEHRDLWGKLISKTPPARANSDRS